MDQFNLFKKSLEEFQTSAEDLPINLLNPIFVKLESLLGELHYGNNNVNDRINFLVVHLEKRSQKRPYNKVFYMYSVVLLVDEMFRYYRSYIDMLVEASQETLEIEDHKDKDEYWLTSWHPSKVVDKKKFEEGVIESEKQWRFHTEKLRIALFDSAFTPPLDRSLDSWGMLKGK